MGVSAMAAGQEKVIYKYHPATNLVAAKFIKDGHKIILRTFFEYVNAVQVEKIIDDGSSENKHDLQNVTERHITRTKLTQVDPKHPHQCVPGGLPECIEEKYLDKSTGNEVLLKRICNEYSPLGQILKRKIYDAHENLAYEQEWRYDLLGNVIIEKDPLGYIIKRRYDAKNNLIEEEHCSQNRIIKHKYDFYNHRIGTEEKHSDGLGLVKTFKYDLRGNLVEEVDHFGKKTTHHYDKFDRVIRTTYPAVIDAQSRLLENVISKEYDAAGNIIAITDQQKGITTKSYNVHGKPLTIRYPDGSIESFAYYLDGNLRTVIGRNGSVTEHFYDYFGRLIKKEMRSSNASLLRTTSNKYNAFHIISTTDFNDIETLYKYDDAGHLISVSKEDPVDHGKHLTTYEYDSLGRIEKTNEWYKSDAYKSICRFYDVLGRVLEEVTKEGVTGEILQHHAFKYDADGNLTEKTIHTAKGNSTTITHYNSRKQPIEIIDALGNKTHITYNYTNFLESEQTDALGNKTKSIFNAQGKLATVIKMSVHGQQLSRKDLFYNLFGDPSETHETVVSPGKPNRKVISRFEYDAMHQIRDLTEAVGKIEQKHSHIDYNSAGQKERIIKPDGTQILHAYDGFGRLKSLRASDDSFFYAYEYDLNDNPICIRDVINNTITRREYDNFGRLWLEQLAHGQTIEYKYDWLDRPLHVAFTDGSGVDYVYNCMQLKKLDRKSVSGEILYTHTNQTHDLFGNVLRMTLPEKAGIEISTYDALGRILSTSATGCKEFISYDVRGNLIGVKTKFSGIIIESKYEYDDAHQIKSETGVTNHNYMYDSLYNCVVKDGVEGNFNALNQLLQRGAVTYFYNSNGNLNQKNKEDQFVKYTYDALDRLRTVLSNDMKHEYQYDAFNRRISKQSYIKIGDEWRKGEKYFYLYQGQNEIGKLDSEGKILELRVLGTGKGAEIGAAVALELGEKKVVPVHDHNGNVMALIDMCNGEVLETYRYSVFGEEKIFDQKFNAMTYSEVGNPWRFADKRVDEETGFIYMGESYYEPEECRWITPDPIGNEVPDYIQRYKDKNDKGKRRSTF